MKWSAVLLLGGLTGCLKGATVQLEPTPTASAQAPKSAQGIYRHLVKNAYGQTVSLASHQGHPSLVVNTASRCGYTAQYAQLQTLHQRYQARGLRVVGFPANDFGNQEPGSDKEIQDFCRANFGVTFPVYAKIAVSGPSKHALYRSLTEQSDEAFRGEVRWNFEKFLIDGNGRVVGRFQSGIAPDDRRLTDALDRLLR